MTDLEHVVVNADDIDDTLDQLEEHFGGPDALARWLTGIAKQVLVLDPGQYSRVVVMTKPHFETYKAAMGLEDQKPGAIVALDQLRRLGRFDVELLRMAALINEARPQLIQRVKHAVVDNGLGVIWDVTTGRVLLVPIEGTIEAPVARIAVTHLDGSEIIN